MTRHCMKVEQTNIKTTGQDVQMPGVMEIVMKEVGNQGYHREESPNWIVRNYFHIIRQRNIPGKAGIKLERINDLINTKSFRAF